MQRQTDELYQADTHLLGFRRVAGRQRSALRPQQHCRVSSSEERWWSPGYLKLQQASRFCHGLQEEIPKDWVAEEEERTWGISLPVDQEETSDAAPERGQGFLQAALRGEADGRPAICGRSLNAEIAVPAPEQLPEVGCW